MGTADRDDDGRDAFLSHVRKKKILYHASGIVSVILMCTRLILTVTEVILEMNISNLLQM